MENLDINKITSLLKKIQKRPTTTAATFNFRDILNKLRGKNQEVKSTEKQTEE